MKSSISKSGLQISTLTKGDITSLRKLLITSFRGALPYSEIFSSESHFQEAVSFVLRNELQLFDIYVVKYEGEIVGSFTLISYKMRKSTSLEFLSYFKLITSLNLFELHRLYKYAKAVNKSFSMVKQDFDILCWMTVSKTYQQKKIGSSILHFIHEEITEKIVLTVFDEKIKGFYKKNNFYTVEHNRNHRYFVLSNF